MLLASTSGVWAAVDTRFLEEGGRLTKQQPSADSRKSNTGYAIEVKIPEFPLMLAPLGTVFGFYYLSGGGNQ